MRFPSECYQIHQTLRQTMPHLTEAQSKGLALWTFGTITAQSGCQNAVIAALNFTGGFSAVRQRLREWLYDGADRSTPSPNQIDVRARFRAADGLGLVDVEVRRSRARHRPDNALRQALRRRRERGLSGMRHPGRLDRPARQQTRQVDRPYMRTARSDLCRHSRRHEGDRDCGSRTEKPRSVEKDTRSRLASIHAPAHRYRVLP